MKNYPYVKAVLYVLFFSIASTLTGAETHPFMIVKEAEYDSLRSLADQYPWSAFIKNSHEVIDSIKYSDGKGLLQLYNEGTDLASSLALCYIVYPENREEYVSEFETEVYEFLHDTRERKEHTDIPDSHGFNVGPSQVAFTVYLALDIMYKDIDPVVRKKMEDDLAYIATNHYSKWLESKYSIEGMYALYKYGGQSSEFKEKEQQYKDYLKGAATEDGVYTTGPGYAHTRLFVDRRTQKKIFMDVCEYQGYHDFYSDTLLTDLYEWVFGYSVSPFNRTYTFGDSPPVKPYDKWETSALRVNRFSKTAQNYAAWFIGPPSHFHHTNTLLDYLLLEKLPMEAAKPVSRIFTNGGAWLIGDDYSKNNLSGALWNIHTENESHNHYDVNSINLAGYGELLIRNSGYDNWQAPDEETWKWIHYTAESSNTITINKKNHLSFRGTGVDKSITGFDVEFAETRSGNSIPGGEHARNLILIKSTEGLPGYFIVYDRVKTTEANSVVDVYFHPNSNLSPELSDEEVYNFSIKNCNNLLDDIHLNVVFNESPENVRVKEGYLGSYEKCSRFVGKYLDAEYTTEDSKVCDPVTIFYPTVNNMPQPDFKRVSNDMFNATTVSYNESAVDYIVNPRSEDEVSFGSIKLQGDLGYLRKSAAGNLNMLCLNGKSFVDTEKGIGFESESSITFLLNGTDGEVISNGTQVKIIYPQIKSILVDGIESESTVNGDGWIEVFIPEGNHKISILSDAYVEQKSEEGPYYLSEIKGPTWKTFIRIDYRIPEKETVTINLLDEGGKVVDEILNKPKDKGVYSVFYDTRKLKDGKYYYELITDNKTIKKTLVIKK